MHDSSSIQLLHTPFGSWKTRAAGTEGGVDFTEGAHHLAALMNIILACACDEARVRPDGKVDIHGLFNELSAPGFPAMQDRMTVVFMIEWDRSTEGRIPLRADLVDAKGERLLTIQGHTDVEQREDQERAPAQTRLVMPLEEVIFPKPGRYHFNLKIGDEEHQAISLFVKHVEDEDGPQATSPD